MLQLFVYKNLEITVIEIEGVRYWSVVDICKFLDLPFINLFEDKEFVLTYDLLSLIVELDDNGLYDKSEMLYIFVRESGELENPLICNLYTALKCNYVYNRECDLISKKQLQSEVYLIGCKENNTMKIGYSIDVNGRLHELQISSPFKLEYIIGTKGGRSLEQQLHFEFRDLRISGEWFKWDDRIINKFKYLNNLK